MSDKLTAVELQQLEQQYACPQGAAGIEVAELMHQSNQNMTLNTVAELNLQDNQQILELGHGNAKHLPVVLDRAKNLHYTGLEISKTMCSQAMDYSQAQIQAKKATFCLYDGLSIPFADNQFHAAMSINTLYFWQQPKQLINEIARVLKPNGVAVLTFASQAFLQQMPFVGDRFKFYDETTARALAECSPLQVAGFITLDEPIVSPKGETFTRTFNMLKLYKP